MGVWYQEWEGEATLAGGAGCKSSWPAQVASLSYRSGWNGYASCAGYKPALPDWVNCLSYLRRLQTYATGSGCEPWLPAQVTDLRYRSGGQTCATGACSIEGESLWGAGALGWTPYVPLGGSRLMRTSTSRMLPTKPWSTPLEGGTSW